MGYLVAASLHLFLLYLRRTHRRSPVLPLRRTPLLVVVRLALIRSVGTC